MPQFSLYRHVVKKATELGLEMRSLGEAKLDGTEGELAPESFTARVESMRVWCRVAEKLVLDRRLSDAKVHAGFERMNRLEPVLPRYRRMASLVSELVVYGEPDWEPDVPGIRTVALGNEPLALEWFLVVSARGWKAAIVAEDLDGFGGGTRMAERRFRGFATHHPALVAAALEGLETRLARR
ncbi:MAG: DICT sensory domain-containing protein [Polyangiales bacterium]